jgi:hypothetical protein
VVTNDLRLRANFTARATTIKDSFENMVRQLSEPYRVLTLPRIVATAAVLTD